MGKDVSVIHLETRKALIAAYNFIHCGMSYDDWNIRVHYYLDPIRTPRGIVWRRFDQVYFTDPESFLKAAYDAYIARCRENAYATHEKIKQNALKRKARAAHLNA